VSEGEEHHVKNDDDIDESHKSQLKFEYEIYLSNYTIEIEKKTFKTQTWLLRFLEQGFSTCGPRTPGGLRGASKGPRATPETLETRRILTKQKYRPYQCCR